MSNIPHRGRGGKGYNDQRPIESGDILLKELIASGVFDGKLKIARLALLKGRCCVISNKG